MERHEQGTARVTAVILRPCDWQGTRFGKLLAIPTDGKPVTMFPSQDEAFLEISKAVRKAAEQWELLRLPNRQHRTTFPRCSLCRYY